MHALAARQSLSYGIAQSSIARVTLSATFPNCLLIASGDLVSSVTIACGVVLIEALLLLGGAHGRGVDHVQLL
jgi:hypothetical protein